MSTEIKLLARLGKKNLNVVTISDLMNLTGKSYGAARVSAFRLVKEGILKTIEGKRGIWFNTFGNQEPESIIPRLDIDAYITSESALYRYGLITFVPNKIVVGTPNKSGEINTPYGIIQLFHIPLKYKIDIHENTVTGIKISSREKAILDLIYLNQDKGLGLNVIKIIDQIDKEKLLSLAEFLPIRTKRKLRFYIRK